MIKNIDSLADRLKGVKVNGQELSLDKLSEMISSETEHELEVEKVNLFSDAEIETLKENTRGPAHKDGVVFGVEKMSKAFRKAHDLDFEGTIKYGTDGKVDFDAVVGHISKPYEEKIKTNAKIEPTEQIKEWESKYGTIKETRDREKEAYEKSINELNGKLSNLDIDVSLQKNIPTLSGIKNDHATMIYRAEFNVEKRDNALIVKKGNEIVKDNVGNPVPVKDHFTAFAQDQGWIKTDGRGEHNSNGSGSSFKTVTEVYSFMKEKGIPPGSEEADKLLESVSE